MPRYAVEFKQVSKTYRTGLLRPAPIHALRNVTLAVPQGSVFGIIGPNRAGKTTLVKSLLSICRPTSGTILRFGLLAHDRRTLARIGYLHESQAFPQYLTAASLLRYYGALTLVSPRELNERIPQLLDRVGLTDRAHEPIAAFSKGMSQRLALAQSLVNDPDLLVLDEPTEGMDLAARKLLHDVIGSRRDEGKTAIIVSHSMADISQLCDLVAVLRDGQLAYTGSLSDLVGPTPVDLSSEALQEALEPMYAGASL